MNAIKVWNWKLLDFVLKNWPHKKYLFLNISPSFSSKNLFKIIFKKFFIFFYFNPKFHEKRKKLPDKNLVLF